MLNNINNCIIILPLLSAGDTVKIGEISYKLKIPRNPELVPVKHSMFILFIFKCLNMLKLNIRLHEMKGRLWWQVKQRSLTLCWVLSVSFRLSTSDSGSAPTLDHAERPIGTGRVSHWSPRTPETIHSHAIPREYTRNRYIYIYLL